MDGRYLAASKRLGNASNHSQLRRRSPTLFVTLAAADDVEPAPPLVSATMYQ